MAISGIRARRIRFIIASLQITSGILLVLFVLCLYHRHSSLQQIMEQHVREHAAAATSGPRSNEGQTSDAGLDGDSSGEREENKTQREAAENEEEGLEDGADYGLDTTEYIVGEFAVVCVGVIFIGLILAGLVFDRIYFPIQDAVINQERRANVEEPPQQDNDNAGGMENPARDTSSDEEEHAVEGEEVIEMAAIAEGLREKVE